MARISPRLRRVLAILRSQPALIYLRQCWNAEDREWTEYKRAHNLPDDADPYAGGYF